MIQWRPVHVGFEGDKAEVGGARVWQQAWRRVPIGAVHLPHPAHLQQTHQFHIYEIGPDLSPLRFAAGELSNGVWGFYAPADDWRYRIVDVISAPGPGTVVLVAGSTELPVGARVTVKLETPHGDVLDAAGEKVWELPVDEYVGKHDAFRLEPTGHEVTVGSVAMLVPARVSPPAGVR